jgi:hypothetical protein
VEITLLLCDSAQVAEGKLYVLGGGWTTTTAPFTAPIAVAGLIEVPWNQANQEFHFTVELLTADGEPAVMPGPAGVQPIRVEGAFEVGRPPGSAHGSMLPFPFAVNLGPLPVTPRSRYQVRCTVAGAEVEKVVSFSTADGPELPFPFALPTDG